MTLEANYSNEVGILTERYQTLWAMTVYVNPNKIQYIRLIESVCENKFDIHNEAILKGYLKQKYKLFYKSEDTMIEINNKVISEESSFVASMAAKGGSHIDELDRREIIEEAYERVINKSKKDRKSKAKSATTAKEDANSPKLDL